jgi:hypothetical protein
MSVAPTAAPRRPREKMSETGDPSPSGAAVRVEDIERALVLAREVAAATASGGAANLRIDHLNALFANGNGRADPQRIEAALAAAGLRIDPPLSERPSSVSLRVERRRAALAPKGGAAAKRSTSAPPTADDDPPPRPAGVAAYQAATGATPRAARPAKAEPAGVSLDDAQRLAAADQAAQNTPKAIAALLPAMIVPVLAASFLGPLFGAAFAGLALLASALLSRPGALADGKLGPIRMPASMARSFLLVTFGVALGALATSLALVAAGGSDTKPADPNAPIEQKQQPRSTPSTTTTPPAPPSAQQKQQEQQKAQDAAARQRAERRAAARRRAARERRRRAAAREATPPSGGADTAPAAP